uniref:Putative secreted protein n=1 Tax=Amblyomma americanum TaxID=6943 RepID=A0A0C9SDC0_AMBAM
MHRSYCQSLLRQFFFFGLLTSAPISAKLTKLCCIRVEKENAKGIRFWLSQAFYKHVWIYLMILLECRLMKQNGRATWGFQLAQFFYNDVVAHRTVSLRQCVVSWNAKGAPRFHNLYSLF